MSTEEIISEFISKNKTLIVAPAGYGKTYTIVECIQQLPNNTKSLILTHTHAGIASIKAKLKDKRIDPKKYQVETITSYAQKYVKSYCLEKLPDIENSKQYWEFVLEKSVDLFKNSHIQRVINLSYNHLFVDEYQDCSKKQHQMILALSEILPTHILGDPLQGIIDFNHDLVDFETDIFPIFDKQELKEPYRWIHYGSKELGEYLRKYLAKELGLNVLLKQASDLISPYVGETEIKISKAFDEAKNKKAMLIIDEADSFLQSRQNAVRNWEVSQVNQMLTSMENHPYPFVCTTNLIDILDEASLRRFTFKIKFNFLNKEQVKKAFKHYFKIEAPDEIVNLYGLTLGDFSTVYKKSDYLDCRDNNTELAKLLQDEVNMKSKDIIGSRIGF